MTYFVYLIGNYKKTKLTTYVGGGKNLKNRLKLHNNGQGAKFTKGSVWKLLYYEKFKTKSEAISREIYIKKNRRFRNLIKKRYL